MFRSYSEPTVTEKSLSSFGRGWSTTGDLSDLYRSNSEKSKESNMKKKKVLKFHTHVRVILVTTRAEYVSAGLANMMWWNESDYAHFKETAFQELRDLIANSPKRIDSKSALSILYQPGVPELPDESFSDNNDYELHYSTTSISTPLSPSPPHPPINSPLPSTSAYNSSYLLKRHSFSEESSTPRPLPSTKSSMDDIQISGLLLRAGTDRDLNIRKEQDIVSFVTNKTMSQVVPLRPLSLLCGPI